MGRKKIYIGELKWIKINYNIMEKQNYYYRK